MKKKILFIVSSMKVGGGAEKSVSLLVKGLSKYYDVQLLTFYDFEKEYDVKQVKRNSFAEKYCENVFVKAYRFFIKYPLMLKIFLKRNKYDLVISNAEDANLISLFTKKFFYKFDLWCVIRNNIFDDKNVFYKFNKLHKYADKNIVLTNELKNLAFKNGLETINISNALDIKEINVLKNKELNEKNHFNKKNHFNHRKIFIAKKSFMVF
jgi:hypothetical protein